MDERKMSEEEREEARLLKTMAGRKGSANKPGGGAGGAGAAGGAKKDVVAAFAEQRKAPAARPPHQSETAREISSGVDDRVELPSCEHVTVSEAEAEKILAEFMAGKLSQDDPRVQAALGGAKNRVHEVYKVHHEPTKTQWAKGVAEDYQKRVDGTAKAEAEAARKEASAARLRVARQKEDQEALEAERAAAGKAEREATLRAYRTEGASGERARLTPLEAAFCEAVTALRRAPADVASQLRAERGVDAYDAEEPLVLLLHNNAATGVVTRLRTAEGAAAAADAVAALDAAAAPLPALRVSPGLTHCMFDAMIKALPSGRAPNALEAVGGGAYGAVRGAARQIMYRGPVGTARDALLSLVIDDGHAERGRRRALLDDKWHAVGVAATMEADGCTMCVYVLLAAEFEEKKEE